MKLSRLSSLAVIFFASSAWVNAQTVFEQHPPVGENVRLAWAIDADGGVNGDEFKGFEVAYASEIYPLDQMLISFTNSNPEGNSQQTVMLAVEEYYPIAESFKFYGVAGLGYMWTDFSAESGGDSTGWVGKIGGGGILTLSEALDLYAEIAYYGSDRNLWLDGPNAVDSQNWGALLGLRFKY
ncbi:MAG: hypothetical protein ACO3N7_05070 [Kiritimatiellia bacterium]